MQRTARIPQSHVNAKAIRLLAESRVEPAGAAAAFVVEGDNGTYHTVIGEDFSFCSCPAHGSCSHIRAATILQDALVDGVAAAVARHSVAS